MANKMTTLSPDCCVDINELGRLFSRSAATIKFWTTKKGLPRRPDGNYDLKSSIFWLEKYYRTSAKPKVKFESLEQQQIAELLGVRRQTIAAWTRAGLPRNSKSTYDLKRVCRWMLEHYQGLAAKIYQERLASLQNKLCRNVRQLEKFFERENNIFPRS